MTAPLRRLITPLCLLALGFATTASADPVAPPGDAGGSFAAAAQAASGSGCRSLNVIDFDQVQALPQSRWAVRHAGRIRCEVPIRSRCHATLFRRDVKVSEITNTGRNRCRVGTEFFGSHPSGTRFTQTYSYRLTLRNPDQRWSGTSEYCPERRDRRRTLICRDSHTTRSPNPSLDRHP